MRSVGACRFSVETDSFDTVDGDKSTVCDTKSGGGRDRTSQSKFVAFRRIRRFKI